MLKQATIEEPLIYDLVGSKGGSAILFVAQTLELELVLRSEHLPVHEPRRQGIIVDHVDQYPPHRHGLALQHQRFSEPGGEVVAKSIWSR